MRWEVVFSVQQFDFMACQSYFENAYGVIERGTERTAMCVRRFSKKKSLFIVQNVNAF